MVQTQKENVEHDERVRLRKWIGISFFIALAFLAGIFSSFYRTSHPIFRQLIEVFGCAIIAIVLGVVAYGLLTWGISEISALFRTFSKPNYLQLKRIMAFDKGYLSSWFIEVDGQILAKLSRPTIEESFWYRFRLKVLAQDSRSRECCLSEDFWRSNDDRIVFRNSVNNQVCEDATTGSLKQFPSGTFYLTVRGLPTFGIVWYERIWLAFVRRRGRTERPVDRLRLD